MTQMVGDAVAPDDDACPLECAAFNDELPDDLLLALDPATVPGQWADAGMAAAFRAENHWAWARSRWTWEAWRATTGTTERVADRPRAGKIPAASLGWSERYGTAQIEFARQILIRLPALGEAMREGWLEERKAAKFVNIVAELDDVQARLVVERLLGRAPGWTFAQLQARVEAEAMAVDPGWAEARKAAAVARRRVVFRAAPSGAAELSGLDLPPETAQDAYDRIVALADVVHDRLRAVGRDAPQGPIQTEVLLVLTGPDGAGRWDDDVIDLVLARFTTNPGDSDGPDDGPDPDGSPDDEPGPDGGPDAGGGPEDGPARGSDDHPDEGADGAAASSSRPGPDEPGPDDAAESGSPDSGGPDSGGPDSGGPDSGADTDADADGTASPPRAVPFRARVAIRLGLRTVMGLDRRPGEIPGQGSVCSSTARAMAWARTQTSWRLHLYDDHGQLERLLTVRPPTRGSPTDSRRRRHIVELTAHTRELDDLLAGIGIPPGPEILESGALTLLTRAGRALAADRARPAHEHPAVSRADAHRRRPGAELARWVQARDRTCRSLGCTRQAIGADLDHTLAWDDGGETIADDLGVICEADHLFKHDPTTGWTVAQPSPGTFVWTAPTGTRHVITAEPYDPLPDPLTPEDGSPFTLPAGTYAPAPPTPDPFTPRRTRDGRITAAARATADAMAERHRVQRGEPPSRYDHDPDF